MNTWTLNGRILYVTAILLAGMLLTLAGASPAWTDGRRLQDQIADYHRFMSEHPKASTQIRENPRLVYDKKFLNSHPEVERFLKSHPEIRQEIAKRPERVFGWPEREGSRYGRYHQDNRRFGWWRH